MKAKALLSTFFRSLLFTPLFPVRRGKKEKKKVTKNRPLLLTPTPYSFPLSPFRSRREERGEEGEREGTNAQRTKMKTESKKEFPEYFSFKLRRGK